MTAPKTILVCVNVDCHERGSPLVLEGLLAQREAGVLPADVDIREYMCFSACRKGPNVVIVEDQVWYCGVRSTDTAEIAEALRAGVPVERLTAGTNAITRRLIFTVLEAGLLPGDVR
jgi:(2Fe-2S) ferredoxin